MKTATQAHHSSQTSTRIGLLLLVALAVWLGYGYFGDSLLEAGETAPLWSLPISGRDGENLEMTDLRGKVVVLDFWSTTCAPCLRQIKELESLHRSMGDRVAVVGVAVGGERLEELDKFDRDRNVSYPLVLGNSSMASAYEVETLPTLYILDATGRVFRGHRGFWPREEIAAAVKGALGND